MWPHGRYLGVIFNGLSQLGNEHLAVIRNSEVAVLQGFSHCGSICKFNPDQSFWPLYSRWLHVVQGWPLRGVPLYWNFRDTLTVENGIVDQVVIPKTLRPEILQRLHGSHQGSLSNCTIFIYQVIFVLYIWAFILVCNQT